MMWNLPCHPESSFRDVASAKSAANAFARDHGYALVVKSVCRDSSGQHRRIIMGCDRHGARRAYVSRSIRRRVNAGSRRCGCPMELNIVRRGEVGSASERWCLEHRGKAVAHNHSPSTHPAAHPAHRRAARTLAVRNAIVADAEIGVRAAQTIARLNLQDDDNLLLHRDVYNERRRAVNERVGGFTRMEYLLRELEAGDYFVEFDVDDQSRVTDLFFAFDLAIDIYRDNSDVILLDCTYKKNRFGVPLLNIVGITGTNSTIHVAQAFIRNEQVPDYAWALRQLYAMMEQRNIRPPQVFFSDAELALINEIEVIFPGAPHLLCLWHIVKNVETHARKNTFRRVRDEAASSSTSVKWKDSDGHRNFCDAFLRVVWATSEDEYEYRKRELHMLSEAEAGYIDDVWLSHWRRRLVRCWTDNVVHFGLQATSRVVGYHATMKAWLGTSRGDFLTIHSRLRHWWVQSVNKYWTTRAIERTRTPNRLRRPLYEAVVSVITSHALRQTDNIRLSTELLIRPCSGSYSATHGMPCAHQIHAAISNGNRLQPEQFHAHWWLDSGAAPVPPPPRVLEPETIADRRAQRRTDRRRQRQRGSGRWGTRRIPSQFEMSIMQTPDTM